MGWILSASNTISSAHYMGELFGPMGVMGIVAEFSTGRNTTSRINGAGFQRWAYSSFL